MTSLLLLLLLAGAVTWLLRRTPIERIYLPDGSAGWMRHGSSIVVDAEFPRTRLIRLSGEMLVKLQIHDRPLQLKTPRLLLTASTSAVLVVTSWPMDKSAVVAVLEGAVDVQRAYASPWHDRAHLTAGRSALLAGEIDLLDDSSTQAPDIPGWTRQYWPRFRRP
jgi:ferric-dicitrate binding protein FerR (iron transport regulator)